MARRGHARTPNERLKLKGCPEFEAIKKKHGGSLPPDYEGKLEIFIREKKAAQGISSVTVVQEPVVEQEGEYTESDFTDDGIEEGEMSNGSAVCRKY